MNENVMMESAQIEISAIFSLNGDASLAFSAVSLNIAANREHMHS